jgi:EpsI family protein
VLLTAGLGCAWAEYFRQEVYAEGLPDLDRLSHDYGGWHGKDQPVQAAVAEMLSCDRILCRTYTDALGRELQTWVMFWANPASTANVHNPDVCWPSRGWILSRKEVKPVALDDGPAELPITRREFHRERDRQMILYWSQRGHRVLTEAAEADELYGYQSWVTVLLTDSGRWEDTACLAVLVGADFNGSPEPTEKMLQDFCAALATDLYRTCPWALPETPARPK